MPPPWIASPAARNDKLLRRRGASGSRGMDELLIEGDVVVLLGVPAGLKASEERLLTAK